MAPLFPRQHLCLVLCEMATASWPDWQFENPDDWRAAWCIAVLRAWCFGEATLPELRAALGGEAGGSDDDGDFFDSGFEDSELEQAPGTAAAAAIARAVQTALTEDFADLAAGVAHAVACAHAAVAEAEAEDRYERLCDRHAEEAQLRYDEDDSPADALADDESLAFEEDEAEARAEAIARGAWSSEFKQWLARSAAVTRHLMPWRERPATDWRPEPGPVFTGDAMLRIDGWVLRDGVRLADFAQLEPERAVAFDGAQLEARCTRIQRWSDPPEGSPNKSTQ